MSTNNSYNNDQIIACLRSLRETIDKLQELLGAPAEDTMERLYRRRRELLTRLYASGGLDQRGLFSLLDEHETPQPVDRPAGQVRLCREVSTTQRARTCM